MLTSSTPSIQKRIYHRIASLGVASKADLLKEFSLTTSSMTRLLEEMTSQGMINVSGLGSSTGGRKPNLFQTNPTYRYVFGLEISRIYSSLGLYDMHFNKLSAVRWKMDKEMTPERFVEHVTAETRRFLQAHNITAAQILGMGIGAVGPLNQKKGLILKPEFFPADSWLNVPICEMLEERLQIRVQLDNGANTALIGEHWALRDGSITDMLYVHVGAGIRSAMMAGGSVLRGAVDREGAIGQMIIQTDGPRLHDRGNYGALEAFVSGAALKKKVIGQLKIGRNSLLDSLPIEDIQFTALVDAFSQGDALVKEQFTKAAAYLGIGLANLINAMHPEYVILGGALVGAHPLVYDTAVEVAKKNTYHYPEYNPVFSQGLLQEEAVAAGAAVMMVHEWEG